MQPAAFARLGACLFAVSAPAIAQANTTDTNATILVLAASQADQAERALRATPGGVDFVRAEDYADKWIVSLRDTLAFSPGVYVQPRYGQEVRLSIRGSGLSRGFHMRGITLLQDGVPVNLADDNGDFQELDPTFYDHLQIYRGGNALRFGSGTLGGAVNGVTPTGRSAPGAYVRLDGGSFNTVRGLVSAGFARGIGDAWAALQVDSSDGDRDHVERDTLRFHGNVGLMFSEAVSTRFYTSINRIRQQIPGALDRATVLTRPESGNRFGDQARDIDSIRVQNLTQLVLGDVNIALGGFINAKQLYHPIFQVVDQESNDVGVSARLDYVTGPIELTLGTSAQFGDVRSKRFVNINGKRGAPTFAADQTARSVRVYGEARVRPVERLTLVAGGIYADGLRKQDQVLPTIVQGEANFSAFSPKVGVIWEPASDVQFYANYNRSVEFPGFIELAQIAAFVPVSPQRAWTAEVGSRGHAGIVRWDVSFYRSTLKGELLQFAVGPDIPASTFNAARTRHQGIEAGLDLQPLDWLRLRQIWQYSDFGFRDDAQYGDNRLPVIPKHLYRAEVRVGTDALHIAPSVEWVPQAAYADYNNSTRGSAYTLFGLTAGARVAQGFDVFFDVRNMLGEKAIGDISATITASPTSVIYYPVERRAVYGGFRARF